MADKTSKNRRELLLGSFVLIVTLSLLVSLFVFSPLKVLVTPKVPITVVTTTGEGLVVGMKVKISGFDIATVNDIQLESVNEIILKILIPIKYLPLVKQDSQVRLNTPLLGSAYIEIFGGSDSSPVVDSGHSYKISSHNSLDQLSQEIIPILNDLQSIVSTFETEVTDENSKMNIALSNLLDLSSDFTAEDGELRSFMASLDQLGVTLSDPEGGFNSFVEGLGQLGNDIQYGEGNIGYLNSDEFREEIDRLLDTINLAGDSLYTSLNETEQLVREMRPLLLNFADDLGSSTDSAPKVLDQMDRTLNELNRTLRALRGSWILGGETEEEETLVE